MEMIEGTPKFVYNNRTDHVRGFGELQPAENRGEMTEDRKEWH